MKNVYLFNGNELRAQKEFNMNAPLNVAEYEKLKSRIPYVPLAGERFDEINFIYPLRIPDIPRAFTVNEKNTAFSLFFICNKESVSVIGDEAMEKLYSEHAGHFVFGVGTKSEKHKNGKTYNNMKLRGWLLAKMKNDPSTGKTAKKK